MIRHCDDCRSELESVLTKSQEIWLNGHPGLVEVWYCPNADNHGKTVECRNCGQQVPSANYHYSYTPGLFGSGKFSCFKPRPPRCHEPALKQPVYEPDPPGVTTIRHGGYVMCNRFLPCPDHPKDDA